jgi:hypothetical protein
MGRRNNQVVGGTSAASIPARAAATLLACIVRAGRRVPTAGAAVTWLCVAAVLLAGCGSSGQAGPGAPGTGRSTVASGAWREDTSGTRQPLYAVACLSALRCEAVGAAGTILSTGDGGATWRAQASPLQGSSKILYRIACAAPSSCYVIARPDTILVTHNGGVTWSSHVLPLPGVGASLTSPECPPGPVGGPGAQPCQLGLLDIACVSASTCYAVATGPAGYFYGPIPIPGQAGPPNAIWMTSDGGTSWTLQSVPAGVGCTNGDCGNLLYHYPLEWISCLGSGLCRAGGGYFGGCGNCGYVYAVVAVTRPGAPWTMLTCQPGFPCYNALMAIHPFPHGVAFSPDAGVCPTSARCYGVSLDTGNGVAWSADGGELWLEGSSGASSIRNAIACPAARTCYTAGDQGTITRTVNGTAWVADGRPTARDLYGITCVDAVTCYAVGDGGTIVARQ